MLRDSASHTISESDRLLSGVYVHHLKNSNYTCPSYKGQLLTEHGNVYDIVT